MQNKQALIQKLEISSQRQHMGLIRFFTSLVILGGLSLPLMAQDDMEEWEFNSEYPNKLVIGVGGVNVAGDEGQFLQRVGLAESFYGGLEELIYRSELENEVLLKVDAKAIPGIEDYLAKVKFTKEDLGFLEFGYESYRTYYDATGGYDPVSDYYYTYFDESLHLDRSKLWIAAQWNNGNGTSLDLKYTYRVRDGKKGTTSWADGTSALGGRVYIVPGFYDIDETRSTFEVDLNHRNESLAINLGGVWETHEMDNRRQFRRQPETSADRYVVHQEDFETDMFNSHGSLSYQFNEKTRLNIGTAYTTLDTILKGNRTINGGFSTVYDPNFLRQYRDHGFLDLHGETNVKQWVMNGNLEILATENLQIVPSIRLENYDTDSIADVLETGAGRDGVDSFHELQPFGNSYWDDVAGEIALVYRGISNVVLSAEYYASSGEGDLSETETDLETSVIEFERDTKRERSEQKLSASLKYYPQAGLNFVLNVYHKEGKNDFDHFIDPTANTGGDRFPAYYEQMDFLTNDANFRISWRPTKQLSLVSRVDYQQSTISQRAADLKLVDSGEMETVIFSEAFTFIPNDKFMLQGSMSFVRDRLGTPTDELNGVSDQLVPDINNDYWQVDLTATFALNAKRSLIVRGFHYESDGYLNNADVTVPYGYTDEQSSVTAMLRQKIDDFTSVSVQYGYYDLGEMTSGGRNDYEAHVLYCRWERQF